MIPHQVEYGGETDLRRQWPRIAGFASGAAVSAPTHPAKTR